MKKLRIRLYHIVPADTYVVIFIFGHVCRMSERLPSQKTAIALANDICAHMGMIPEFVR